jgi:UDP-glucuronate 4-epimerase
VEAALGLTARKELLPMQDGDVPATYADTRAIQSWTGFAPSTSIDVGVRAFVEWYRNYYKA